MKNSRVTIRDVARVAGVSVATVSRHLNGSDRILPETLKRVQEAMKDLAFVPSSSARNLATNRTGSLGLLLTTISGEFFTPLVSGIEEWASKGGYSLITASTGHATPGPPPLNPQNCDALIVVAQALPPVWFDRWTAEGFPMVVLYEEGPQGVPSVTVENRMAMGRMVRHLIADHRRRRFLYLTGPQGNFDAQERELGFWAALGQAGIPRHEALVEPGEFDREPARQSVHRVAAEGGIFDAVVAADDESAYGALQALHELGLRVPEDVSVTGFDDLGFASMLMPALTTVDSPSSLVGKTAVELLLAQLAGRPVPSRTVVPTVTRWRSSCGCHPPKTE